MPKPTKLRSKDSVGLPCLTLGLLLSAPASVYASTLEEVVVSASYRDTQLNETVGSVSVISEEVIATRSARHLEDILQTVPNVSWSSGSSRSRFLQVRGIGDLEQYYDPKYFPSVGIMLDSLELGDSANAGMLFDIAQVEVLRGPQGTRFGSSAHAGMVTLKAQQPTDTFSGEASAGYGDYNTYNAGLVLNGPLSDSTNARIAVQQSGSDGYNDNNVSNSDNTNDLDELSVRSKLQWIPNKQSLYDLSLVYFDSDNGYDAWSLNNDRTTFTDQPGKDTQETIAASASGTWELSSGLLVEANISYLDTELHQDYDADWASDALCIEFDCSYGSGGTTQEIFDRDRQRIIADVRVLGGSDNPAKGESRYVVGVYANQGDEEYDYQFPSAGSETFSSSFDYDTERYALYGEYEYQVSDSIALVSGLRLEQFQDDFSDPVAFQSSNSETLWNAELSLRYTLGDNTQAYATLAQGQKPSGVNTTASANRAYMSPVFQDFIGDNQTFDKETLINKEVGIRSRQLDGKLNISLAIFHTDRENAQLENWMWDEASSLWVGYLDSNSDATSYGLELESSFLATENIELYANLGWLETEVDTIEAFDLDVYDFVTREDREQAKAPNYQYNLGTRISFTDSLSAHLEVEGQDSSFFGYYHDGKLDSYDLLNASISWASGPLAIRAWSRNLTDEDYAVHGLYFGVDPRDDFAAWSNQTYTQLGAPRTYGVDVTYSF
jgi:iron complex outermembrane recepter protein